MQMCTNAPCIVSIPHEVWGKMYLFQEGLWFMFTVSMQVQNTSAYYSLFHLVEKPETLRSCHIANWANWWRV